MFPDNNFPGKPLPLFPISNLKSIYVEHYFPQQVPRSRTLKGMWIFS